MEITINLSKEAIDKIARKIAIINKEEIYEEEINKIAKKVALINEEKAKKTKKEVIIPVEKSFHYSVKDVAEMTKVSKGTITKHIRQKHLTASKIGKSWKISRENYLAYISEGLYN